MLKFTEWPKTPGTTSRKTWFFLKRISCLQLLFVLILMKKRWYGSIYKEMELEMDCLTSRILLRKGCSYKCQFCTKVCASSRLVSQIPIKMLKQHATHQTCNFTNSPHFWKNRSVFLKIWHQSSRSWDITPLHFFSSRFIYFKEPIKVQIWWNFMWAVGSLKFCTLMSSFCPNHVQFQLKMYRRVTCHDTEEWCKVERKTDL